MVLGKEYLKSSLPAREGYDLKSILMKEVRAGCFNIELGPYKSVLSNRGALISGVL